MILGMSVPAFTLLHVIISLVGIATGLVVVLAMLAGKRLAGWTGLFLATTVLTSVTGFFFHSTAFGPPHVVGVLSLVILALAIPALVKLLSDDTPVDQPVCNQKGSWRSKGDNKTSPGEMAAIALTKMGAASVDPLIDALKADAFQARFCRSKISATRARRDES